MEGTEQTQTVPQVTITTMQKLVKAEMCGRRQLDVLNIRLNEIDKRLKMCKENGPKSHRYTLRQRRRIIENVRNMYGIYVRRKTMAVARMILTNFSNSINLSNGPETQEETGISSTEQSNADVSTSSSSSSSDESMNEVSDESFNTETTR